MSDDQQQTKILSDNDRDNIDKNIQDPESLLINIFSIFVKIYFFNTKQNDPAAGKEFAATETC